MIKKEVFRLIEILDLSRLTLYTGMIWEFVFAKLTINSFGEFKTKYLLTKSKAYESYKVGYKFDYRKHRFTTLLYNHFILGCCI